MFLFADVDDEGEEDEVTFILFHLLDKKFKQTGSDLFSQNLKKCSFELWNLLYISLMIIHANPVIWVACFLG